MMENTIKSIAVQAINTATKVVFGMLLAAALGAYAQSKDGVADVAVQNAWVRTSVQGQSSTGAYMTLTAKSSLQLVGARSAVAGLAEVHSMTMSGDIMQMRAVPVLDLPAGKAVALSANTFHLMFFDLKAALPKNSTVPLTLLFKDAKGVKSTLDLMLPVLVVAPAGSTATPMNQHKH
jgi:periplasmic copper chaperone A